MPFPQRRPVHTQEGVLVDSGFFKTEYWSECWACGEASHRCKPGVIRDIWRCSACDTEWATPSWERMVWFQNLHATPAERKEAS